MPLASVDVVAETEPVRFTVMPFRGLAILSTTRPVIFRLPGVGVGVGVGVGIGVGVGVDVGVGLGVGVGIGVGVGVGAGVGVGVGVAKPLHFPALPAP